MTKIAAQPIESVLLAHNAAPVAQVDEASQIRAQARLEQILATDPTQTGEPLAAASRRALPRALRWVAIPATAAVVIGLGIALPGSPGTVSAFANWAAEPQPVPLADLAAADAACFGTLDRAWPYTAERASLTVSELRGDWAFLLYTGPAIGSAQLPITVACLYNARADDDVFFMDGIDAINSGITASETPGDWLVPGEMRRYFASGWQGDPGPEQFQPLRSHTVLLSDDGHAALTGRVGAEVTGLTIHTAVGDVQATVADGFFAAWWPVTDQAQAGNSGSPDDFQVAGTELSYTVTLRDGRVLTDAEPANLAEFLSLLSG